MQITMFNPPYLFDSSSGPVSGSDPMDLIYQLESNYLMAATWTDVLTLHTSASASMITQMGMQATWQYAHDNPQPWVEACSALVAIPLTESNLYYKQALPQNVDLNFFENSTSFMVTAYRLTSGGLLFDVTLEANQPSNILTYARPSLLSCAMEFRDLYPGSIHPS